MRKLKIAFEDAFDAPVQKSPLPDPDPRAKEVSKSKKLTLAEFSKFVTLTDILQKLGYSRDKIKEDSLATVGGLYMNKVFFIEFEGVPSGFQIFKNLDILTEFAQDSYIEWLKTAVENKQEFSDDFYEKYLYMPSFTLSQLHSSEMDSFGEYSYIDSSDLERDEVYQHLGEDPRRPETDWEDAKQKYLEDQYEAHSNEIYEQLDNDPIAYLWDFLHMSPKEALDHGYLAIDYEAVASEWGEKASPGELVKQLGFQNMWQVGQYFICKE